METTGIAKARKGKIKNDLIMMFGILTGKVDADELNFSGLQLGELVGATVWLVG